ncbi:primosomal protein N' [Marinobacterium lutimaris]|uniref:Replication restart protein PriA n=1 Tax=Marinobacterium lutimaris TaxID=568106 RepID=A0A1H6D9K3_9GAMM|nr:primosomal protein N' [Marinobacterium lutimaris]SEG81858.1 replication restart DNA helicase PriA [Marinobacterium lutimaris]
MIVRIALPTPLHRLFDYLLPLTPVEQEPQPGCRVRVPFGNRELVGLIMEVSENSDVPRNKLKPVHEILDSEPVVDPTLFKLGQWAARYYQHPMGDALSHLLPVLLRQGKPAEFAHAELWRAVDGAAVDKLSSSAHRQRELLELLLEHPAGISADALRAEGGQTPLLKTLAEKGLAEAFEHRPTPLHADLTEDLLNEPALPVHGEQADALEAIYAASGFTPFLLYGVTGSGKTEIYLQAIEKTLAAGKQALVLVPEIGLTPQTLGRFRARFRVPVHALHSNLSDRERLDTWLHARAGSARIIIGTRSAIFTPMKNPGLIIVDEEHDGSFKQQDGFRYHARDLALVRASRENVPVILGSATPALETLHNASSGRYQLLKLTQRAGNARAPRFELLDIRQQPLEAGLSDELIRRIHQHLGSGTQVMLFLNRRGFSPSLICNNCGTVVDCTRCDAHMTLHRNPPHLHCHHCDRQTPIPRACSHCGSTELKPLGIGTERAEDALQKHFPDVPILRVDRDSTSRKSALEKMMAVVHSGEPCILVGTQMLAKGHHFPKVTLVAILDADAGLFSADFRGMEKTAQLILQVAGRAGRADHPGEVVLQTLHAEHPMLQTLIGSDYLHFAQQEMKLRYAAALPPFAHHAIVRGEASRQGWAEQFLQELDQSARTQVQMPEGVQVIGPFPSPMEKRGGLFRAQLLISAKTRPALHAWLGALIRQAEADPQGRRVRWTLDVDPIDNY